MTSLQAVQVFFRSSAVLYRSLRPVVTWNKNSPQIFSSAASSQALTAKVIRTSPVCGCSAVCGVKYSVVKQSAQQATMSNTTATTTQQSVTSPDLKVQHDESNKAFVITLGQDKALLEYQPAEGGAVDLWHTEVPPAFRGKGVAKLLAQAALDHFAEKSTPMRLSCTYLQKYVKDFPQPAHQKFILPD